MKLFINTFMKVRKPKIDYDSINKYWFYKNSLTTYFMSSLMTSFPEGEKFFIRAVREKGIESEDVKKFIAQEAHHSIEHKKLLKEVEKSGLRITKVVSFIEKVFFLKKFSVGNIMKYFFGKNIELSVTAGLEHITSCCLCPFPAKINLRRYVDLPMANMLIWHALEEFEHKNVAYDVLQKESKSYFKRILGLILGTIFLTVITSYGMIYLIITDKNYKKNIQDIPFFLVFIAGLLKYTTKDYLRYFKPSFHPSQIDDSRFIPRLEAKVASFV
jgi:predicted metal-dependent hydrolase